MIYFLYLLNMPVWTAYIIPESGSGHAFVNVTSETVEVHSNNFNNLSNHYLLKYYVALAENKVYVIDDLIIFNCMNENDSFDEFDSLIYRDHYDDDYDDNYDGNPYKQIKLDYVNACILAYYSDKNIIPDNARCYYFQDYILIKFKTNTVKECQTIVDLLPNRKAECYNIYEKN